MAQSVEPFPRQRTQSPRPAAFLGMHGQQEALYRTIPDAVPRHERAVDSTREEHDRCCAGIDAGRDHGRTWAGALPTIAWLLQRLVSRVLPATRFLAR